jgi:hypothetical protein
MMDDLYFIQDERNRVKIGRAKEPVKRLKQLQGGTADTLELRWVLEGRGYEEKVWHYAFCVERARGEWFELSEQLEWAIVAAMDGKPWWDHIMPPPNFDWSEDPDEHDDDIVDWQIAVHLAVAAAAEKVGLTARHAGRNIFEQDNEPPVERRRFAQTRG